MSSSSIAITAPASIVCATAPEALAQLSAALGEQGGSIDLADCAVFDSSLIAVLLELRRRDASADGARLRVLNPPSNLRKLAALYGVDGILFDERN
jgi:ABC-type transporter Mla MlaB component